MNRVFKLVLFILCLTTPIAFALNPVQDWYAGMIIGGNYTPSIKFNGVLSKFNKYEEGKLTYSNLIDIGGQVGYRVENTRLELEGLFNNSPYNGITIGNTFINASNTSSTLAIQGYTNTYAIMVNGYYDAFGLFDWENVVPYAGIGVGGSYVSSTIEFYYDETAITQTQRTSHDYLFILQGIIGLSYFLDDFTSFGLDFRYLTNTNVMLNYDTTNRSGNNYPVFSTNYRPQLYTVNLSFNGAFNLGA